MTPLGVLVAVGASPYETALLDAIALSGLRVVRRCVDLTDLLAVIATGQAQAAIVSADLASLDAAAVAAVRASGTVVVGLIAERRGSDESALQRLGITDFVTPEAPDAITEAIAGAVDAGQSGSSGDVADADVGVGREAGEAAGRPVGRLAAVWGGAGSPGRSTVSLGLAAALASSGRAVLAVDADVYGGALGQMLGLLDESSGLLASTRAANFGVLDSAGLTGAARRVTDGLDVLTGLPRPDRWPEVSPVLLRQVLEVARDSYDWVVADLGFSVETDEEVSFDVAAPRRNGATLRVLESADEVVVVGGADPVGLSRLVRAVHDLHEELPAVHPLVVVNGMRRSLGWSEHEVADTLGTVASVGAVRFLPWDQPACDAALVHGRLLRESAASSRLTLALGELAAAVAGESHPPRAAWWRLRPAAGERCA